MTETIDRALSELGERDRRELRGHCYRILGSIDDAEDAVQDTLLRAWRKRATVRGGSLRPWLYRIATNASLDVLARRVRRAQSTQTPEAAGDMDSDALLESIPAEGAVPDAELVAKETIELAFLAVIQHLTPRQRDVLILRVVLGYPAKDAASMLGISVASVNSSLQRARIRLRDELPERRSEWAPGRAPSREERTLLRRYLHGVELGDARAFPIELPAFGERSR